MSKKLTYEELENRLRHLETAASDCNETQKTLGRSIDNYRAIFDAANDAILIHELGNGNILDVNQAMVEMFGYTEKEVLQLDVEALSEGIPPYSMVEAKKNIQKAAGGEPHIFEWRSRKKNGDLFWTEVSLKTVILDGEKRIIAIIRDISARKQAETQLKSQRDRLEYIIEGTHAGTWEWNVQTGEAVFNERWADIIGYTLDEIMPTSVETWMKHTHPKDLEQCKDALERHFSGESDYYEIECRMKHKDGHWVWILDKGKVVSRTDDGKPFWMYGIHLDITHRKQAKERLRRSEELSNTIQHLSKTGAWEWDINTQTVFWTDEVYRIHGMEPGFEAHNTDITIEKSLHCYRPEDRPVIRKAFSKCVEQGVSYNLEVPFTTIDGRRKWIQTSARRVSDKSGVNRVVGYFMDITERKQNEEALRREEKKYRTILHTAADGFWLTDLRGKLLEVNDAYCRMSGYSEKELLSMHIPELEGNMGPEEVAAKIDDVLKQSLSRFETRHMRKDGGLYDVDISAKYLAIEDGRLVNFIRDITMHKEAEKEKKSLQAQLAQAQKMEAVGRLAGGVAHDFNNMLNVINGYGEMALEDTDPNHEIHTYLKQIMQAARHSADITRQLLAFARRQTIAPKVLDLNETVTTMIKMIQRLIGEDIHLTWLPGKELRPIKVDPSQIDQILVNLCINARDAIRGVGNLTIETDAVSLDEDYCQSHLGFVPGEFVRLSVSDDGCGMDKDTLQSIFEPFFTTKGVDEGTGLGLAMVYGIVKQNAGFINAYSEPGIGTTFRIYLPQTETFGKQAMEKNVAAPDVRGGETILLVEDEPLVLKLTQTMLKKLGYNVLAAITPKQAIILACQHGGRIHLLLSDVVMPEMNGLELSDRLRSLIPDLKHLFMSGYTANVIAHHGILDEGVNYIQKPFSRKDLSVKLREVLNDVNDTISQ